MPGGFLNLTTARPRSIGLSRDTDSLHRIGRQKAAPPQGFRIPSAVGPPKLSRGSTSRDQSMDADADVYADPESSVESEASSELSSVPSNISAKSGSSSRKRSREDAGPAVAAPAGWDTNDVVWGKERKRPKQTYGSAKFGAKATGGPTAKKDIGTKRVGKRGASFQEPQQLALKSRGNIPRTEFRRGPPLPQQKSSPTSPTFKDPATLPRETAGRNNGTRIQRKSAKKGKDYSSPRPLEEPKTTATPVQLDPESSGGFKAPHTLGDSTPRRKPNLKITTDAESVSSLSSPPDSPILSQQQHEDSPSHRAPSSPKQDPPLCPMCRAVLPADFLSSNGSSSSSYIFSRPRRPNIREQAAICHAHKKHAAQLEYAARGYPPIQWDALEPRLAAAAPHVRAILDGAAPSAFRDELAARAAAGTAPRTLLQSVNSEAFAALTPGYYGTRGARALGAFVAREFGARLRELAPRDRLIAAGGVSGYVQAVLVPELAAWLVERDLRVGPERAREVLRESIALGDLVNEEVEDEITEQVGDEDADGQGGDELLYVM